MRRWARISHHVCGRGCGGGLGLQPVLGLQGVQPVLRLPCDAQLVAICPQVAVRDVVATGHAVRIAKLVQHAPRRLSVELNQLLQLCLGQVQLVRRNFASAAAIVIRRAISDAHGLRRNWIPLRGRDVASDPVAVRPRHPVRLVEVVGTQLAIVAAIVGAHETVPGAHCMNETT